MIRKAVLPVLFLVIAALSACGERQQGASIDNADADRQMAASEQDGIRWFEGSVDEAFDVARAQQKPIPRKKSSTVTGSIYAVFPLLSSSIPTEIR